MDAAGGNFTEQMNILVQSRRFFNVIFSRDFRFRRFLK